MVEVYNQLHETKVALYEPSQRARLGWWGAFKRIAADCRDNRELIGQLFKRDYLMMYKRSFLGMGWHLAAPIMGILSWVLLNATGVLDPGDVGIPYPAYILLSTSIWGFFLATFSQTSQVLDIAKGFIQQVGFPHHVLLVKQWLQVLANYAISFVAMLALLMLMGVFPAPAAVLFPILLVPILVFGSAVGLVAAVLGVVTPDAQKAVTFFMGFWMYLTPVIFSSKIDSPLLVTIMRWNPMTYLLNGARDIFVRGRLEEPLAYGVTVLAVFVVFLITLRVFFITEEKIVEKML